MKVLILNLKSGHYLACDGTWTPSAINAKDFRHSSHAYAHIKKEKLNGQRVRFYFEEFDYTIGVPKWPGERLATQLSAGAMDF